MRPTTALPDDPRLPGLMAIRDSGLARAIPALGLEQGGGGLELELCGYHPGARATLEARVGRRRFAVKAFADDPAPEAALYQALGAAALAGDSGARVPPLLAWDHDLRVLVIGWLEGPTTHQLVKQGQGRRGGPGAGRGAGAHGATGRRQRAPGARDAVRPPHPRPRGRPGRDRLASLRAGAGGARRRDVPGHTVPAAAAASSARRRGVTGG